MRTHGKKFRAAAKNRDEAAVYQPKQALEIVKKSAFAKFDETVEVAVRLGVDPRHADQIVRGTVVLPAGTGKSVRVLVIAVGDKAREAEAAGADFVGAEHIAKIKEGWLDFDVMIATPDQMGQVGQLGRVLGPRGLMPNPKAGTVTFDVGRAVRETKAGKIEFRVDKGGNVHAADRQGLVLARRARDELLGVHGSDRPREAERGEGRLCPQRRGVEHDGPRRSRRHHPVPVTSDEQDREAAARHRADRQDQGRQGALLHRLHGLNVKRMTELRRRLRKAGVEYVVIKNTLALRAINESGLTGTSDSAVRRALS